MARLLGRGGQARVTEASGMSRNTVIAGTREVAGGVGPSERVRAKGAGPKLLIDTRPGLLEALDEQRQMTRTRGRGRIGTEMHAKHTCDDIWPGQTGRRARALDQAGRRAPRSCTNANAQLRWSERSLSVHFCTDPPATPTRVVRR